MVFEGDTPDFLVPGLCSILKGSTMLLSLILPVYNEADVLPTTLAELRRVLSKMDCEYEIIFVDDGSQDATATFLSRQAENDPRVKVLRFTRNFGHQVALTAGLDFASGNAVIVMDADLQDPPDLIPLMVDAHLNGYHVVSPQRMFRRSDSFVKRWTADAFYWLMRTMVDPRLQPEVGDFRLFSREAVHALRHFREEHRFMRGLVAWLGLREAFLPFERMPRAAGKTKYPFWKMVRFAWTAISSFSALPLRLSVSLGFLTVIFGFGYSIYSVYKGVILGETVTGWTSLVCLQIIFSGATLLAIGLVGEYLARVYEEAKNRPLYIIGSTSNIEPEWVQSRAIVLGDALIEARRPVRVDRA